MNKRRTARQTFYKSYAGAKPFDFHRARNNIAASMLYKKLVHSEEKPFLDLNININPDIFSNKRKISDFKHSDMITIDRWKQKYSPERQKQKSPRKIITNCYSQQLPLIKQLNKQTKRNTDEWYDSLIKKRSESVKQLNGMLSTKKLSSQQMSLLNKTHKSKVLRNTMGNFKQRYGVEHNFGKQKLKKKKQLKSEFILQNLNPQRWDVISEIQQNQINNQQQF